MAMGQQKDRQGDLMVGWAEMPRSPGHVFYDRLHLEGGFDAFAEASCRPYYAARMGAPSVPPGRYFRMHLVGYFEGTQSAAGVALLGFPVASGVPAAENRERVPDSWLSRTRTRLPHESHGDLRLGSPDCRSRSGQGRSYRGCLDHGGQRRCATSCEGTRARVTDAGALDQPCHRCGSGGGFRLAKPGSGAGLSHRFPRCPAGQKLRDAKAARLRTRPFIGSGRHPEGAT